MLFNMWSLVTSCGARVSHPFVLRCDFVSKMESHLFQLPPQFTAALTNRATAIQESKEFSEKVIQSSNIKFITISWKMWIPKLVELTMFCTAKQSGLWDWHGRGACNGNSETEIEVTIKLFSLTLLEPVHTLY